MKPEIRKIRMALTVFIILLALSGITAFPLRTEIQFLVKHISVFPPLLQNWIMQVSSCIQQTPVVILYGTDWLAFAHIIIALFFVPVFIDPLKYKINLQIGMAACVLVFPLAFICGPIRNIPFFHQLIDCSFGLIGISFLYFVYTRINKLKTDENVNI
jgi:hypothetical protein